MLGAPVQHRAIPSSLIPMPLQVEGAVQFGHLANLSDIPHLAMCFWSINEKMSPSRWALLPVNAWDLKDAKQTPEHSLCTSCIPHACGASMSYVHHNLFGRHYHQEASCSSSWNGLVAVDPPPVKVYLLWGLVESP